MLGATLEYIFLCSHILLLFQKPVGDKNKLQNINHWENIFHIALGTVRQQLPYILMELNRRGTQKQHLLGVF